MLIVAPCLRVRIVKAGGFLLSRHGGGFCTIFFTAKTGAIFL